MNGNAALTPTGIRCLPSLHEIPNHRGDDEEREHSRPLQVSGVDEAILTMPSESMEDESEDGRPRIPRAWRMRETLIQELQRPYEQLYNQTLNWPRPSLHQFHDTHSLRSVRAERSHSQILQPPPVLNYATLPTRPTGRESRQKGTNFHQTPSVPTRPQPESFDIEHLGSFHQFQFRSDLPPPRMAMRELDSDARSIGSQFVPSLLTNPNGTLTKPPGSVVMLDGVPHALVPLVPGTPMSSRSNAMRLIPQPEFAATTSDSGTSSESKECCGSAYIVLWLCISVILIGAIVGIAVTFARKNNHVAEFIST